MDPKLTYDNVLYFGKDFSKKKRKGVDYHVQSMVFDGKINFDGTLDETMLAQMTKSDVWLYIYYLWKNNNKTIPEFKDMTSFRATARFGTITSSPKRVVSVVSEFIFGLYEKLQAQNPDVQYKVTKFLTVHELILFVNVIVNKYNSGSQPALKTPVVSETFDKLEKALIKKEEEMQKRIENIDKAYKNVIDQAKNTHVQFKTFAIDTNGSVIPLPHQERKDNTKVNLYLSLEPNASKI